MSFFYENDPFDQADQQDPFGSNPGPGVPAPGPSPAPPAPLQLTSWLPTPGAPHGGGGAGGGGGEDYSNFPDVNFGAVPQFKAPVFGAPTLQDAEKEPGYQFRLQSGQDALEHSAAAKGLLRTGGTLKDIIGYGQNFASQEYGNVYNRALQSFDRLYQGQHDQYAPMLSQWQTNAQAQLAKALAQYGRYTSWNAPHGGGGGGGVYDPEPQPYGFQ